MRTTSARHRDPVLLGLLLGATFGLWNLIVTWRSPLLEDTPRTLLLFYGPMFTVWGLAGFVAFRRTGRLLEAVKVAATVALVTFVVFDLAVILRVNLFLDEIRRRSDWQNLVARFQASGFDSFRMYANYVYLSGAPFKILVALTIGAATGLLGGLAAALGRRVWGSARR
jgi:hypothetical protein